MAQGRKEEEEEEEETQHKLKLSTSFLVKYLPQRHHSTNELLVQFVAFSTLVLIDFNLVSC